MTPEDEMSVSEEVATGAGRRPSEAAGEAVCSPWLLSPALDGLLIANLAWPVLVLFQSTAGFAEHSGISFLQLYFVTTPHRWITLAVILTDRQRFLRYRTPFLIIAGLVITLTLMTRLLTQALTCLLAVDYAWNAWHFAAQHHGIRRIYQKSAGAAHNSGGTAEKWILRGFVLFVIVRTAASTASEAAWQLLAHADIPMLLLAVILLLRCLASPRPHKIGEFLYLLSTLALYSALLLSVRFVQPELTLRLATASAWFHASEYLAVVAWRIQQQSSVEATSAGAAWGLLAGCGLNLITFMLVTGFSSWQLQQAAEETWLTVNVIVAFMHYACDGMIWKSLPTSPRIH
ncbi:MAG: hypothetical protein ACKOEO_05015 [Planctomycetaceae bacterium]